MRHRLGLLPSHGRNLPRNFQHRQNKVGSQIRLRVRGKLQGAPERVRQKRHKKAHRRKYLFLRLIFAGGQAGEGEVPGQPGILSVDQAIFRSELLGRTLQRRRSVERRKGRPARICSTVEIHLQMDFYLERIGVRFEK